MSKALVAYYSETGNTLKVAEAIYEALQGEKEISPLAELGSLDAYDLVFIGFPLHDHGVPDAAQNLLKKVPKNKKIALFSTHGALTGSTLSREAIEHAAVLASKAQLLGTFTCRGKVPYSVLERLGGDPEHKAWAEMAASARVHPNETDLEEAKVFAKWVNSKSSGKKGPTR
jgi:flavodoxin